MKRLPKTVGTKKVKHLVKNPHTLHSKETKHKTFRDNNGLKKWLKLALWGSGISVILGFLIYKSFFFLGAFLPLSVIGIWHIIRKTEKQIQKFDVFSK